LEPHIFDSGDHFGSFEISVCGITASFTGIVYQVYSQRCSSGARTGIDGCSSGRSRSSRSSRSSRRWILDLKRIEGKEVVRSRWQKYQEGEVGECRDMG
jgi:hypothetical protein